MQPVERWKNLTFDFETYHAHLSPFLYIFTHPFLTLYLTPKNPSFTNPK